MGECVICGLEGCVETPLARDAVKMDCRQCGEYEITSSLLATFKYTKENNIPHTVSSWIRESYMELGKPPILTTDNFIEILAIPDKPLKSKFEKFMEAIDTHLSQIEPNRLIHPTEEPVWFSITWSKDCDELISIVDEAIKRGLIKAEKKRSYTDGGCNWYLSDVSLTFDGREFVESLGQTGGNSNKVFMAFHFTDDMKLSFEVTAKRAVTDASAGKLEAVRVGTSSTPTDTKIDDALIAMLKASKVVIADFTGQRQAVYYEAGYAMGMGIPVIWTCRTNEVDALSFDTRQYPHILWKDEEDLYKQLKERLYAQIL